MPCGDACARKLLRCACCDARPRAAGCGRARTREASTCRACPGRRDGRCSLSTATAPTTTSSSRPTTRSSTSAQFSDWLRALWPTYCAVEGESEEDEDEDEGEGESEEEYDYDSDDSDDGW